MKRLALLSVITCLYSISARTQPLVDQQVYVDSLLKLMKHDPSADGKAQASFSLVEYFLYSDTVKAKEYLQKGLDYSKGNTFYRLMHEFYLARLVSLSDPDRALSMYEKTEKALQRLNTQRALLLRAKCWSDYAKVLQRKDDGEGFVGMLLNKVIPLAVEAGDSTFLGKSYLDVSLGFKNMGDYATAESYLKNSIEVLRDRTDAVQHLASAYHTLAENYILGDKVDAAAPLLDSMKTLLTPYPDAAMWIDYYVAECMRLTVGGAHEQSLSVAEKGIALAESLGLEYEKQRVIMQKFYAFFEKGAFSQAKNVAMMLLSNPAFARLATNRTQMYYGLALTHEKLGDFQRAYEWSQKYASLSDSLSKAETMTKINALEVKYQTAEKEKKIAVLEAQQKQSTFEIKTARLGNLLWATVSVIILLVGGFLLYFFRNRHHQELKALEQQQTLAVSEALLAGEERERQRVARDLHDGLGGTLSGIKIKLDGLLRNGSAAVLNEIIGQLEGSIVELRRIARNMMPGSLIRSGLEIAIRDLCASIASDHTEVEFQANGIQQDIPMGTQVHIYRIVQELLANALKHGHASKVMVQCVQDGKTFLITVEDNGRGFNTHSVTNLKGIGLNNIKNRVKYLHGNLDIESAPNDGTSINIELFI